MVKLNHHLYLLPPSVFGVAVVVWGSGGGGGREGGREEATTHTPISTYLTLTLTQPHLAMAKGV